VVVFPPFALDGVHWAKDGTTFICIVDRCDVTYTTKYNYLQAHHNVIEPNKPKHPSI